MGKWLLFAVALLGIGCTQARQPKALPKVAVQNLRSQTEAERMTDYDYLVNLIREYYGPLEFKEKRFNFKLDELVSEVRTKTLAAKSDAEAVGAMKSLLAHFQDGHVSLTPTLELESKYTIPFAITPVDGKVLVAVATDDQYGIAVGDEVLEVDGRTPLSYMPTILKYEALGNDVSNQHLVTKLLSRPTYIPELIPTSPTVLLKIAKPDGKIIERAVVWNLEKGSFHVEKTFPTLGVLTHAYSEKAAEAIAHIQQMGAETPFFATPQVLEQFKFVRVVPSKQYLEKHGLTGDSKVPELYAALYRFEGKSLLLLRMATYTISDPKERMSWMKALLDEYGSLVDALVIDQTHNPGGSVEYAQQFMSIFADGQTRGVANFLNADRRMIALFGEAANSKDITDEYKRFFELSYKLVESAYDKGLSLTESAISFDGQPYVKQIETPFTKPILFLIDELAGSCGDIVPMLMKSNKRAVLFGERTMGLGGNVDLVGHLPVSHAALRLTRGFFVTYSPDGKYDLANPIENNGVTPDLPYKHTVKDFRAGYVDYVSAFSKAAAELK